MNGDTSTRAERIGTVYNIGQVGSIGALPADTHKEIPEPELRLPEHAIVGRSELVAEVLAGMKAGVHDFAFEFLPGIGKTTVAAELIRDPELRGLFDGVLWPISARPRTSAANCSSGPRRSGSTKPPSPNARPTASSAVPSPPGSASAGCC